jgi:hypothetical protein
MPGRAGLLQIFHHVAVPHIVAEAGGVGHQVAQRDRISRGPQFRFAIGVETFQHLRCGEIRQQLADRSLQRELALFHKLHRGGRGDGLGHGRDPEHAVRRHGVVSGQVALAERALVDDLIGAGGDRDHAGYFFCVGLLAQRLIDLSFALHMAPPVLIFLSRRSSPRVPARRSGLLGESRSRDAGGRQTALKPANRPASACGFAMDRLAMPQLNRHTLRRSMQVRLLEQLLR